MIAKAKVKAETTYDENAINDPNPGRRKTGDLIMRIVPSDHTL